MANTERMEKCRFALLPPIIPQEEIRAVRRWMPMEI